MIRYAVMAACAVLAVTVGIMLVSPWCIAPLEASDYIAERFRQSKLKPLGANHTYFQDSRYSLTPVRNVIGYLEGTDPKLKDEAVLVTTHYDNQPFEKDVAPEEGVPAGFAEALPGLAGLLRIIKLLPAQNLCTRRSIIFAACDGKGKEYRGWKHCLGNLPFPIDNISLIINLDSRFEEGIQQHSITVSEPLSEGLIETLQLVSITIPGKGELTIARVGKGKLSPLRIIKVEDNVEEGILTPAISERLSRSKIPFLNSLISIPAPSLQTEESSKSLSVFVEEMSKALTVSIRCAADRGETRRMENGK